MFKKENAIWPGIIQQPVNAGSHGIIVKTARPGVDFRRALASLDYRSQ